VESVPVLVLDLEWAPGPALVLVLLPEPELELVQVQETGLAPAVEAEAEAEAEVEAGQDRHPGVRPGLDQVEVEAPGWRSGYRRRSRSQSCRYGSMQSAGTGRPDTAGSRPPGRPAVA